MREILRSVAPKSFHAAFWSESTEHCVAGTWGAFLVLEGLEAAVMCLLVEARKQLSHQQVH